MLFSISIVMVSSYKKIQRGGLSMSQTYFVEWALLISTCNVGLNRTRC